MNQPADATAAAPRLVLLLAAARSTAVPPRTTTTTANMIILLVGVLLSTALFSGFPEIWMDQPAGAAAVTSTAPRLLLLLAAAKSTTAAAPQTTTTAANMIILLVVVLMHYFPDLQKFGSIDLLVLESIGHRVDSGCFRRSVQCGDGNRRQLIFHSIIACQFNHFRLGRWWVLWLLEISGIALVW